MNPFLASSIFFAGLYALDKFTGRKRRAGVARKAFADKLYDDGYKIIKQKGFKDNKEKDLPRPPTSAPNCPLCNGGQVILDNNGTYGCPFCGGRGQWKGTEEGVVFI